MDTLIGVVLGVLMVFAFILGLPWFTVWFLRYEAWVERRAR